MLNEEMRGRRSIHRPYCVQSQLSQRATDGMYIDILRSIWHMCYMQEPITALSILNSFGVLFNGKSLCVSRQHRVKGLLTITRDKRHILAVIVHKIAHAFDHFRRAGKKRPKDDAYRKSVDQVAKCIILLSKIDLNV